MLIILVILGIVFKDKLRHFWFRIKSKGKFRPGPKGSGMIFNGRPAPPRRMVPQRKTIPVRRVLPRARKTDGELSDVLKKLKEMGK